MVRRRGREGPSEKQGWNVSNKKNAQRFMAAGLCAILFSLKNGIFSTRRSLKLHFPALLIIIVIVIINIIIGEQKKGEFFAYVVIISIY